MSDDAPAADPLDRPWLFSRLRELVEDNQRLADENVFLRRELFYSRHSNKALAAMYRRWADQLESLPERTP
ncbi:hypothetical protein [Microbacterium sp. KNMS]